MSTTPQNNMPNFEVPAEMREFAERSVDQARKTMEGFVSAAMKAFETFDGPAGQMGMNTKDLREHTFRIAEENLQAAFSHASRLIQVQDPTEAVKLQMEFMQAQFASMQKQMSDFVNVAQSAAGDMAKKNFARTPAATDGSGSAS